MTHNFLVFDVILMQLFRHDDVYDVMERITFLSVRVENVPNMKNLIYF